MENSHSFSYPSFVGMEQLINITFAQYNSILLVENLFRIGEIAHINVPTI